MIRVIPTILLLTAVGWSQSAKVVPVDASTTARLTRLSNELKSAQAAYDKAISEAKWDLLTTYDSKHGECFAGHEGYDGTTLSPSLNITFSGGYLRTECETAKEKADRLAYEAKLKAEGEAWEKAHPKRYWLDGFCNGAVFTDDYRYVVPASVPAPAVNKSPYFWVPTTSGTGTTATIPTYTTN